MWWTTIFAFVCSLPLLILLSLKWRYSYWKRKGVAQLNPELFYGDLRELLTAKASVGEAFKNLYVNFKSQNVRFGGVYWAFKPVFIPLDLQLIKEVALKSFSHFQERGYYNHEKDILTNNLFTMKVDAWKTLRAKLTPTFTSSKIKLMVETLCEKIGVLQSVIDECVEKEGKINVSDISARFTIDVIGSCAFGVECDSLRNPDCDFRLNSRKINRPQPVKQWMENTFPRQLLYYIGYKSHPHLEDFFRNLVVTTINHREKHDIFRKDFMHYLLQLRNRGVLSDDGKIQKDENSKGVLTDDEIVAQCFLFFGAGYDSSSSTMTYALFELAQHQDIQDKVRKEIRQVFAKYDGKLTYDGAKELVLTEKVILETLRKYPALPTIPRICTKPFKIPDSNVVIDKGTSVEIPVWGVHMDPKYYPDPEKFDPERFSEEAKAKRPDLSYLAFGEGPRVCIAATFGVLQTKVGMSGLLKDYKYTLSEETAKKLSFRPSMLILHPLEEITLNIEKV